jgi:predicted DNA binding protein
MDERLARAPIGVVDVGHDGTVRGVNDAARDLLDVTEPVGESVEAAFPRSVEGSLRAALSGATVDAAEFEEYYPDVDEWLSVAVVPTGDGVTVYVDSVTARRRHTQTVERLRAERERIAVIDDLLSDVLAELVTASSRVETLETVCERLGETDLYEFAWGGERAVGGDDVAVRSAVGETGETFAAVREALAADATVAERRAVETGEVQVVQPLADDPGTPESVRMAAFGDGIQSLLAVPLTYGSTVYGVVGVYAAGTDAFGERERESFATLGEVAGFAVTAARHRNLLLSDTVTELTVAVDATPLAAASDRLDATLGLDGLVYRSDGSLLCYVAAETASADAVAEAVAAADGVAAARVVADEGGRVQAEIEAGTPLLALASSGATVRTATFEAGAGRIDVELPADGDVRRVADTLDRAFDAEVVAKRERERPVTTAREFRDALGDRLTDRQETALRTAYYADYFESPRASSAEEVADSLGITGSTLLYHLRASQRKLLEAFFEPETAEE